MLSTLFRLGLLAGFVAVARRILAPESSPPPRLEPPRGGRARNSLHRERLEAGDRP
jgi:hypothetical protein